MNGTFSHKYALKSEVMYELTEFDTYISDTLIITAKIPLGPEDPNYDESKAVELAMAVREYEKSRGSPYKRVRIIGGR